MGMKGDFCCFFLSDKYVVHNSRREQNRTIISVILYGIPPPTLPCLCSLIRLYSQKYVFSPCSPWLEEHVPKMENKCWPSWVFDDYINLFLQFILYFNIDSSWFFLDHFEFARSIYLFRRRWGIASKRSIRKFPSKCEQLEISFLQSPLITFKQNHSAH